MKTIRKKCLSCNEPRPFDKEEPNHLLHLFVTIFSAGMWGVFWLCIWVAFLIEPYRCRTCGAKG